MNGGENGDVGIGVGGWMVDELSRELRSRSRLKDRVFSAYQARSGVRR